MHSTCLINVQILSKSHGVVTLQHCTNVALSSCAVLEDKMYHFNMFNTLFHIQFCRYFFLIISSLLYSWLDSRLDGGWQVSTACLFILFFVPINHCLSMLSVTLYMLNTDCQWINTVYCTDPVRRYMYCTAQPNPDLITQIISRQ